MLFPTFLIITSHPYLFNDLGKHKMKRHKWPCLPGVWYYNRYRLPLHQICLQKCCQIIISFIFICYLSKIINDMNSFWTGSYWLHSLRMALSTKSATLCKYLKMWLSPQKIEVARLTLFFFNESKDLVSACLGLLTLHLFIVPSGIVTFLDFPLRPTFQQRSWLLRCWLAIREERERSLSLLIFSAFSQPWCQGTKLSFVNLISFDFIYTKVNINCSYIISYLTVI